MLFAIFTAHEGKFKDTPTSSTISGQQKTGLEIICNTFRPYFTFFSLVWTGAEVSNCQDINKKNNPIINTLKKSNPGILTISSQQKAFCSPQLQVNCCHRLKKCLHLLMQTLHWQKRALTARSPFSYLTGAIQIKAPTTKAPQSRSIVIKVAKTTKQQAQTEVNYCYKRLL